MYNAHGNRVPAVKPVNSKGREKKKRNVFQNNLHDCNSALSGLIRQEDCGMFEDSLGYVREFKTSLQYIVRP